MLQVIYIFYTICPKNYLFVSANTYEKHIVKKENCIVHHDVKMCFFPNFRYHILLKGDIKDLLQKLEAFCFNYQHVDSLYIIFKNRFFARNVVNSGQLFDNVQRAVHFNHKNQRNGQNAQHPEKKTLEEKVQKSFVEFLPKD